MYKLKYIKFIQFQILFIFPLRLCVSFKQNKTETEHLKLERVRDICAKKDIYCESSPKYYLCTIRVENGILKTKDFDNYCSFFLVNMCECPGNEWAIKDSGSCQNVNLRRFQEQIENVTPPMEAENVTEDTVTEGDQEAVTEGDGEAVNEEDEEAVTEGDEETTTEGDGEAVTEGDEEAATEGDGETTTEGEGEATTEGDGEAMTEGEDETTTAGDGEAVTEGEGETVTEGDREDEITAVIDVPTAFNGLRSKLSDIKYTIDAAPDDHPCPLFCTDLYSPVCVNINRGMGLYYKLLFFVNHCEADRHYCMYWDTEYTPPPHYEYEMVNQPSNAAWSYCAASKYMNFATFAESAASLAHYGWLRGSQRPEHIMEPHERVPGYG